MNKKYKINVIIPVYNTEKYLSATLKSLINQSIGFSNILVILVNDGSKDNSEKICLRYSRSYSNIKYISKANGGVSSARNEGIKYVQAKYTMFLDSDDKLSENALECLYNFFENHYNEIDFVISRVKLFGSSNRWHYEDYRFESSRVVDVLDNITYAQYHSTGVLFKTFAIKDKKFNEHIKYGEDMDYMLNLLLENSKIGIEKNSILYYRKRFDDSSAVQKQKTDKSFYLDTINRYFEPAFEKLEKKYKTIPLYYQYFLMNSLRERLDIEPNKVIKVIGEKHYEEYVKKIRKFLDKIDPSIILMQPNLDIYYAINATNKELIKDYNIYKDKITVNDNDVSLNEANLIEVVNLDCIENKIIIEVKQNYLYTSEVMLNDIKPKSVKDSITTFDNKEVSFKKYKYELPLNNQNYSFKIGKVEIPFRINKTINSYSKKLYYEIFDKKLITLNGKQIIVRKNNKFKDIKLKYLGVANTKRLGKKVILKLKGIKLK